MERITNTDLDQQFTIKTNNSTSPVRNLVRAVITEDNKIKQVLYGVMVDDDELPVPTKNYPVYY